MENWRDLPHHILVSVFSNLSRQDQSRAALACKSWSEIFASPYLWTSFDLHFYNQPSQEQPVKYIDTYGKHLRKVHISLDQSQECNRLLACDVIKKLAILPERKLQKLKIDFTGENPYFYAGKEFVSALELLFGPPPEKCNIVHHLTDIDLAKLKVSYDDGLLNVLSANNSHLERLNIQNQVLVCNVSPVSLLRLVQKCRKLKDLRVYSCSLSEDVLVALMEADRHPLQHLGISCRREEKYIQDIDGDTWKTLTAQLPKLRVTLSFDHTCPLHKVSVVMKPEVPVQELRLETYTYIYDEIRMATRYYPKTLEKVVINTPMSRNSPEFNESLINLATECDKLRALHVFCVLEKDTVEKILALHPTMAARGSFTLKYERVPHPWIAGKDC